MGKNKIDGGIGGRVGDSEIEQKQRRASLHTAT